MATSQYLRPGSLIEAVRGHLTPDVVRNASSLTGESEASTSKALGGVVPTLLGGISNMASSEQGAGSLIGMVREGGFTSILENPSSFFSGSSAQGMMGVGEELIGSIFGNHGSAVADEVARTSGVKPSSAHSLMSLAAPLVMAVIGKHVISNGLNASGLSSMLMGQRNEFASAMPSGLSRMFGGAEARGPVAVDRDVERDAYVREREPRRDAYATEPLRTESTSRKWMAWLLPLALIVLAFLFFRSIGGRNAGVTGNPSSITLPTGQSLTVPAGSINYKLARFLGDNSAQAPQTFVFDHLNFESGTTQLTADSGPTMKNLSTVLQAYPNAQIQLTGHTDNTGSADANQALSQSRANAVKDILVNSGVAASRVTTNGYGQDRPIASNDTEEGKARNRRIELTVTSK